MIIPQTLMTLVTDIGDSASLLAITVSGSLYLLYRQSYRAMTFLLLSFLVSALFISLAKLAFMGCGSYFHHADVHSPSGHAALSAAVFGAYAILMRRQLESYRRGLPLIVLSALVLAISLSRVCLGYHTLQEIVMGLVIGIISLFVVYLVVLRKKGTAPFDAYALALWAVVPGIVLHGTHTQAENIIHLLASGLKSHLALCGA